MAAASGTSGLIDTDVLIDAARGLAAAVTFLRAQRAAGGVRISIVSSMELVQGCANSAELAEVRKFLRQVAALSVSVTISLAAYSLMEAHFLSHGLLIPDALIGATALEHGLTLYTKNARHFRMMPGLVVSRPY